MCRFIESIRIENGKIWNIDLHNRRINDTRKVHFGAVNSLDIKSIIEPEKYFERTKCRIEYNTDIITIGYSIYHLRPVTSIRLISCDDIDYSFKNSDRSLLNQLFSNRKNCDDILIIKNNLLTDTSICNIALYDGEKWDTPQTPLLKGTQRSYLLSKGLIHSKDINIFDIPRYTKIRLFNALIPFGEIELPADCIINE